MAEPMEEDAADVAARKRAVQIAKEEAELRKRSQVCCLSYQMLHLNHAMYCLRSCSADIMSARFVPFFDSLSTDVAEGCFRYDHVTCTQHVSDTVFGYLLQYTLMHATPDML